jgi:hypothetical protein
MPVSFLDERYCPFHAVFLPHSFTDLLRFFAHGRRSEHVPDGAGKHGMQVFDLAQLRNVKNAPVTFKPDLSFVLDLNKSHENLAKVLIPTEFSQKWMIIEPATARIARLSPFVLPTDGIVPVGVAEWLDADTGTKLMLVYLDRPARLRGEIVHEGRNLQFDITATEAGYMWIQQPEGSGIFRKATWPGRVVLAVMPN